MAIGDSDDLRFRASLDDQVSPKIAKLEAELRKMGATPAEIKMFLRAQDEATPKIKAMNEQLKMMPKEHKLRLNIDTEPAKRAMDTFRAKASKPLDIQLKVTDNIKEVADRLFNLRTRASGIPGGNMLVGLGAGAPILGAAGAAFGAVKSGISVNAQMEQSMVTLQQTLKDQTKATQEMNKLVTIAVKSPFQYKDVLSADVRLRQYNIPAMPGEGGPGNKGWMKPAGDMAAALNTPINQAVEAIADARQGYFIRMMSYGIRMMREDFNTGGKFAGMTYEQGLGQAIRRFEGAQEMQSKTFQGVMSNLKDIMEQKIIKPVGAVPFTALKAVGQGLQDKLMDPDFQEKLGQKMEEVQHAMVKMFAAVQRGKQYFTENLLHPLIDFGKNVLLIGTTFTKTFGGVFIGIVKTLGTVLGGLVKPVVEFVSQHPGMVQMYARYKALSLIGFDTPVDGIKKMTSSLNPLHFSLFGVISGFKELISSPIKIGLGLIAKHILEAHTATKGLEKTMKEAHMSKEFEKVNDELSSMSLGLDTSTAKMKELGAAAIKALKPGTSSEVGVHQAAMAQSLDKQFGIDAKTANRLISAQGIGGTGSFKGDQRTVDDATRALRNLKLSADKLHMSFSDVIRVMDQFKGKADPIGLGGIKGAPYLAAFSKGVHMKGFLNKDQKEAGITTGDALMESMMQSFRHPAAEMFPKMSGGNLWGGASPGLRAELKRLPGKGLNNFFDFDQTQLHKAFWERNKTTNLYAPSVDGAKLSPDEKLRSQIQKVEDIRDRYRANERAERQGQTDANKMADSVGAPHLKLPRLTPPGLGATLPDFNKLAGATSGSQAAQMITEDIKKNEAAMKDLNTQADMYSARVKDLTTETNKWSIQQEQLGIKMQEFQHSLVPLQRHIEDLSYEMQKYQQQTLRPMERQMTRLNEVGAELGNTMNNAQYDMAKFTSGLMEGEQAALNQLHAMERYNRQLQIMQLSYQQIGADLGQTTYDQGFSLRVEPLAGINLAAQAERAQRKQQLAQLKYEDKFGEQHYKVQQAARSRNEKREMSVDDRIEGVKKTQPIIDRITRQQHTLGNVQFALSKKMYAANEELGNQQDKVQGLSLALQDKQLHGGMRAMEDYQYKLQTKSAKANIELNQQQMLLDKTKDRLTDYRDVTDVLNTFWDNIFKTDKNKGDAFKKMIDFAEATKQIDPKQAKELRALADKVQKTANKTSWVTEQDKWQSLITRAIKGVINGDLLRILGDKIKRAIPGKVGDVLGGTGMTVAGTVAMLATVPLILLPLATRLSSEIFKRRLISVGERFPGVTKVLDPVLKSVGHVGSRIPLLRGDPIFEQMKGGIRGLFETPIKSIFSESFRFMRRFRMGGGALVGGALGGIAGSMFGPPGQIIGSMLGARMGGQFGARTPIRKAIPEFFRVFKDALGIPKRFWAAGKDFVKDFGTAVSEYRDGTKTLGGAAKSIQDSAKKGAHTARSNRQNANRQKTAADRQKAASKESKAASHEGKKAADKGTTTAEDMHKAGRKHARAAAKAEEAAIELEKSMVRFDEIVSKMPGAAKVATAAEKVAAAAKKAKAAEAAYEGASVSEKVSLAEKGRKWLNAHPRLSKAARLAGRATDVAYLGMVGAGAAHGNPEDMALAGVGGAAVLGAVAKAGGMAAIKRAVAGMTKKQALKWLAVRGLSHVAGVVGIAQLGYDAYNLLYKPVTGGDLAIPKRESQQWVDQQAYNEKRITRNLGSRERQVLSAIDDAKAVTVGIIAQLKRRHQDTSKMEDRLSQLKADYENKRRDYGKKVGDQVTKDQMTWYKKHLQDQSDHDGAMALLQKTRIRNTKTAEGKGQDDIHKLNADFFRKTHRAFKSFREQLGLTNGDEAQGGPNGDNTTGPTGTPHADSTQSGPYGNGTNRPSANAAGGFLHGKGDSKGYLIRVGEESEEAIIPLAAHRRDRAKSLMKQINARVGAFANGGITDPAYVTAKSVYEKARGFAGGGFTGPHGTLAGMGPVANFAHQKFGMWVSAGKNDHSALTAAGNPSDHAWGGALDLQNKAGSGDAKSSETPQEWAFMRFMKSKVPQIVKQLIFDNKIQYGSGLGGTVTGHMNHVHIALQRAYANDPMRVAKILAAAAKGTDFASLLISGIGGSGDGATMASFKWPHRIPPRLKRMGAFGRAIFQAIKKIRRQSQAKQYASGGGADWSKFHGGGNAQKNRALGKRMAAAMGWTGSEWTALDQLWQHESGWRADADNPTSDAFGIPQAMTNIHKLSAAYLRGDPKAQIAWGLNYIKGKYGKPSGAWGGWGGGNLGVKGYAAGVRDINTDAQLALLHRGERVLHPAAAAASRAKERARLSPRPKTAYQRRMANRAPTPLTAHQRATARGVIRKADATEATRIRNLKKSIETIESTIKKVEKHLAHANDREDKQKDKKDLSALNAALRGRWAALRDPKYDKSIGKAVRAMGDTSGGEGTLALVRGETKKFITAVHKSAVAYTKSTTGRADIRRAHDETGRAHRVAAKARTKHSQGGTRVTRRERTAIRATRTSARKAQKVVKLGLGVSRLRARGRYVVGAAKRGVSDRLIKTITGRGLSKKQKAAYRRVGHAAQGSTAQHKAIIALRKAMDSGNKKQINELRRARAESKAAANRATRATKAAGMGTMKAVHRSSANHVKATKSVADHVRDQGKKTREETKGVRHEGKKGTDATRKADARRAKAENAQDKREREHFKKMESHMAKLVDKDLNVNVHNEAHGAKLTTTIIQNRRRRR